MKVKRKIVNKKAQVNKNSRKIKILRQRKFVAQLAKKPF
jgi:hypothetical protein